MWGREGCEKQICMAQGSGANFMHAERSDFHPEMSVFQDQARTRRTLYTVDSMSWIPTAGFKTRAAHFLDRFTAVRIPGVSLTPTVPSTPCISPGLLLFPFEYFIYLFHFTVSRIPFQTFPGFPLRSIMADLQKIDVRQVGFGWS